ncbi:MAG: hypothetical protein AB7K52_13365 [Phycisphaerales bacterium]
MSDVHRHARRSALLAAAIVIGLFAVAAIGVALSGRQREQAAFDQDRFHLRAIERFAGQCPWFDFRDYESATTPAYHVVLAAVKAATGGGTGMLRVAGAAFTCALLGLLAWWVARQLSAATHPLHPRELLPRRAPEAMSAGALQPLVVLAAVALVLPFAASVYVFSPGVWLLPDNAAWLGVLGVLLIALRREHSAWSIAAGGLLLVLVVLTRQVHIWSAAALVAGAFWAWPRFDAHDGSPWAGGRGAGRLERLGILPPAEERSAAWARAAAGALACLPAAVVLGAFVLLWGGLTPPAFQPRGSTLTNADYTNVAGISPATPALILALIGIFGAFFLGLLRPALRRDAWIAPALIGAAIAFVLAIIPDTSYSFRPPGLADMSRMSGLWNLVKWFEDQSQQYWTRSPAIIVPAMFGGALLGVFWSALARRDALILGTALLAFVAAHTAGALSWQRYFEPFVLMLLILASARVVGRTHPPRWAWFGPVLLSIGQSAVTLSQMR